MFVPLFAVDSEVLHLNPSDAISVANWRSASEDLKALEGALLELWFDVPHLRLFNFSQLLLQREFQELLDLGRV